MKEKFKIILISILIGLIAFPTITLGGTFVSSLIQGKSVEESVTILANQLDALLGRIKIIEREQKEQEKQLKEMECRTLSLETNSGGEYTGDEIIDEYKRRQEKLTELNDFLKYLQSLPNITRKELVNQLAVEDCSDKSEVYLENCIKNSKEEYKERLDVCRGIKKEQNCYELEERFLYAKNPGDVYCPPGEYCTLNQYFAVQDYFSLGLVKHRLNAIQFRFEEIKPLYEEYLSKCEKFQ